MIISDVAGNVAKVKKGSQGLNVNSHLAYDAVSTDLFNRLKVTMLNPQFTYQNEYNKGDLQWVEKLVGTGIAEHDPIDATVNLTVSAAGDKVIRQTRRYLRYFSGKSSQTTITWFTDVMDDYTIFKAGYFDDNNGIFFERDWVTEYIVLRSEGKTTKKIPRSDWNGSTFDSFNFDKSAIFQINLQWLGVGVVQVLFEMPDGEIIVAHTFEGSGVVDSTYMRTANLPIRYEFEAVDGFQGEPSSVKQICASNGVEDGGCGDISKYRHTANTGITPINVETTQRAVIAIRPKATFYGIVNRADVRPSELGLLVGGSNIAYTVVFNPTLTGTVTWVSAGENSPVEYSIDVNTFEGGENIRSGYVAVGSGNTRTVFSSAVQDNYPLGLGVDGDDPTCIVLAAQSFSGTATVSASIGFEEVY